MISLVQIFVDVLMKICTTIIENPEMFSAPLD